MADFQDDYSNFAGAGAAFKGFAEGFRNAKKDEQERVESQAKLEAMQTKMKQDAFENSVAARRSKLAFEGAKSHLDVRTDDQGLYTGSTLNEEYKVLEREKTAADPYGSKAAAAAKLKAELNNPYINLNDADKAIATDSSKKLSDVQAIKDSMDSVREILNDPKQSPEQKMIAAQGALKLINSASLNAPDVVGAEEAKRVGAFLNPSVSNILPGRAGPMFKPDIEAFTAQLNNISDGMGARAEKLKGRVETILRQPIRAGTDIGLVDKGLVPRGTLDAQGTSPKKEKAPKVGEERDGYTFLGGDPADQKNWKAKK